MRALRSARAQSSLIGYGLLTDAAHPLPLVPSNRAAIGVASDSAYGAFRPRAAAVGRRARSRQGAAWKRRASLAVDVPAVLDRFCARRLRCPAVGAKVNLRRGRTKVRLACPSRRPAGGRREHHHQRACCCVPLVAGGGELPVPGAPNQPRSRCRCSGQAGAQTPPAMSHASHR
jgi:hypothetical protein